MNVYKTYIKWRERKGRISKDEVNGLWRECIIIKAKRRITIGAASKGQGYIAQSDKIYYYCIFALPLPHTYI